VLEKVLRWDSARIRRLFASYGLTLLEWDKMRTDRLTIQDSTEHMSVASLPNLTRSTRFNLSNQCKGRQKSALSLFILSEENPASFVCS